MMQLNFPSILLQTFTTAVKQSLLTLAFLLICTVTSAKAHEGRPVFIELTSQKSSDDGSIEYQMKWKIPPVLSKGQQPVISLLGDSCKTLLPGGSEQNQEQKLLVQSFSQGLIGSKHYRCSVVAKDLSVSIAYPSANPALSSLIVVTELSGTSRHIFSAPKKNIISIAADLSAIDVAIQYMAGGIKHILMGWDHLLFVLCLLLIAGTLPRILIAITGFTLSHTITLILASFDLISVPSLFVETLIALSIVVLAAEIIKVRRHLPLGSVIYVPNKDDIKLSLSWRFPVLVAVGFGFVHGFGFASVLSDLGLAPSMKIIALLFFNLGVELGQFLFIAFVICTALVVGKLIAKNTQARIVNLGSYLVGVMASYWLIQRLILGV